LVGGHCIGVDPYYLTYKAKQLGYHAQIINSGRFVNDSMGGYVAKQVVKKIINKDKDIRTARILVMGITFKENVSDIRNSKVVDLIRELESYNVKVDVVDPFADAGEVMEEYGVQLSSAPTGKYDAVIVAVNHHQYIDKSENDFIELSNEKGILIDLKGIYRGKVSELEYWSL
jgi:UDP-N-acetyl-D-galactosamine dehydrogenase